MTSESIEQTRRHVRHGHVVTINNICWRNAHGNALNVTNDMYALSTLRLQFFSWVYLPSKR